MSAEASKGNSLFITMQYLRTVNGVHKYHWALYHAGHNAPKGSLLHATDAGRRALDLRLEIRDVKNPRSSKSMVVCLRIGRTPGMQALKACAEAIPLMDPRSLPRGESQWTCRVWVKHMLYNLGKARYLQLPSDLSSIERSCQMAADYYLRYMGNARVFNDLSWMTLQPPTTPMDTSSNYNSTGYYGSKPMVLDSKTSASRRTTKRSYGSKPMDIDWTAGSYYSR